MRRPNGPFYMSSKLIKIVNTGGSSLYLRYYYFPRPRPRPSPRPRTPPGTLGPLGGAGGCTG